MGDLFINVVALERGKVSTVRLGLGPVADVPLDVEAAKKMVEDVIARSPRGKFRVLGLGPPLVRALVSTPPIGGLGWTMLEAVYGATDGPVRAGSTSLSNEFLSAEVAADGTVTITDLASGARTSGLLRIEDRGDAGDQYNYSPP